MSSQRPAALVTGGGTRLGRHFALALAGRGYDIALHYNSSAEEASEVSDEVRGLGGQCQLFQWDFSSGKDAGELILPVIECFPALNLLINSASTYAPGVSTETSLQQLEQQFTVNFFAPYRLASSFAKQRSNGNIINILDNKIAFQQYHYSAYLLSKKALADFTRMAAIEFAPGIRVNGIAPGVVQPADSRNDAYIDWRVAGIPLAKKGQPEALIRAAEYLLDNDFVTGQILFVDGGEAIDHVGRNSETYPAGEAD